MICNYHKIYFVSYPNHTLEDRAFLGVVTMKENRTDQQYRSNRQVPPNYEQEYRRRQQEQAYRRRQQEAAYLSKKQQEEMQRRQKEAAYLRKKQQEALQRKQQEAAYLRKKQQEELQQKNKQQGIRMRRNYKSQQEMKRKRTGIILLLISLIFVGFLALAAFKLSSFFKLFEGKAEHSDFVATAQSAEQVDEVLNVAILGTDKDGFRTDVNIVASFHTKDHTLSLISVPRDTRVTMTTEMTDYLEEQKRMVPQRNGVYGQCKLTEVHAYAGEGNRCAFSVAMLEELLGIDIDYYVKINLDAFQELVDEIGGVPFHVEERLYYSDPVQGLYIDLYPGEQVLTGEQAEMLVRFRSGYAAGDLKRIEVQQSFIKAVIAQVTNSETLMKNLNGIIRIALEKAETDMPISEALHYATYLSKITPSSVTTDTVPGEGGAYFDLDEEGTKELIDYRIYGIAPPEDEPLAEDSISDTETLSQEDGISDSNE